MLALQVEPPQLLAALDRTIVDLAYDFRGRGAFRFATEADVQSTLLGRLRANVLFHVRATSVKTELVHAEFPAFGTSWKGGARHDLTVWHPSLAGEARKRWGTPPRQWPEKLRHRVNLITVELERFAGLPRDIRQYKMMSPEAQSVVDRKVRDHPDVRKLRESWCEFGYFVVFWDDDVRGKQHLNTCFDCLHKSCTELAQEDSKLRFWCVCRDGSIFTVPSITA